MSKNGSKRFAIFSLILCLILIGVFAFGENVVNMLNKPSVSVTQRRIAKVGLETADYGDWSYAIRWEDKTASMYNFNSDFTSVVVTPTSNGNIAYSLSLQLDRLTAGGNSLAPGELSIALPFYIFDIYNSDSVLVEESSNGIYGVDLYGENAFEVRMGIPSSASASASDLFEFDVDFDNELIYVKNNVAIAADNLSSYNFAINCDVRPSFAVSKSKKTITTTLDIAGDSVISNEIDNTIVSRVTLANLYKQDMMIYDSWDDYWGEEPATDLDSYYYGVFYVDGTLDSNQPYELYITPNAINGELVAYGDDFDFGVGDAQACVDDDFLLYSDYESLQNYFCSVITDVPNDDYFLRVYIVRYSSEYAEDEVGFELDFSIVGSNGSVLRTMGWGLGEDFTNETEEEPILPDEPSDPDEPVTPDPDEPDPDEPEPEDPDVPVIPETPKYPDAAYNELSSMVTSDSSSIGAINKIKNDKKVDFDILVEPGVHEQNVTSAGYVKVFNNWKYSNEGIDDYILELSTDKIVIDSSYNTSTNPLELVAGDYVINSFYPENDNEYDYVLNEDKYILELNNDISTYSSKDVYIKIFDGSWIKIGTYNKNIDGTISYVASDSKTVSNTNVSDINPILLPDNTTDLKVVYTGNKAAVYVGYNMNVSLVSSTNVVSKINSLVDADSEVVLKQESIVNVNSSKVASQFASTYLNKIDSSSFADSNATYDQDENQNTVVSYNATIYEQLNVLSNEYDQYSGMLNEQLGGKYNVLLPKGSSVDSIVVKTYGTDLIANYSSSYIDNYQSTGRQLLVVDINDLSSNIYSGDNYIRSGFTINIRLNYSREANNNYGTNLFIDNAFVSDSGLSSGYATSNSASSALFSSSSVQNAFASLNDLNGDKKLMYSTNSLTVPKVSLVVGSYKKSVKNEISTMYNTNSSIAEGGSYTYRLEYIFSDNLEELSNLVFYDEIDSASGSGFKGYLENVDVSYLKNTVGANPVIYYSTLVDIDLNNEEHRNLSNGTIWSVSKPASLKDVTAIAVDSGDYVIKASDGFVPMVDITMTAPNSYVDGSVSSAINESILVYKSNGIGNGFVKSNTTSVLLNKAQISLDLLVKDKIDGVNLGNGNVDSYVTVFGNYGYLISVINDSDYNYEDVSVGSILPSNIALDEVNMKYYLNDNVGSASSLSGISYVMNSNNILFNIDSIDANTTINLWLPMLIDIDNLGNNSDFTNKAFINSISGNAYNGTFVNSYNRIEIPSIDVNKFVMTKDTVTYTNTVGSVLIDKGEQYKYMIQIDNTSSVVANGIKAVDNVPVGLEVVESTITNLGTYNSSDNTVVWNIGGLLPGESIYLEYAVKVSDDVVLGTKYNSKAHVSLQNPLNTSKLLYDSDTNNISTVYQIASDLRITSLVSGPLADKQKEFTYAISFNGDSSLNDKFDIIKNNEKVGTLQFVNGVASYTTKLIHGDILTIKLLPGAVDYNITQILEDGYITSSSEGSIVNSEYLILGVTSEERLVSYEFNNSYTVSTSVNLGASVTYDKDLLEGMFDVTLSKDGVDIETVSNDSSGNYEFSELSYIDQEGAINYKVRMNQGTNKQISYDSMEYTISVILTNDGKGKLNSEVKYYDKFDNEVSSIVFKNSYVPIGLMIGSLNNSDYVDKDKEFNYSLKITEGIGSYKVLGTDGSQIDTISVDENGEAIYTFKLKSDEKIIVSDLKQGVKYYVEQELASYYTSTVVDMSYTLDVENNLISNTGIIGEESIQVLFDNNYKTVAEFTPIVSLSLTDKVLEDNEFTFVINDISSGSTSGYTEMVTNSADGTVSFNNIKYTRPGTYKYNIGQVKGASNHIYYDMSNCVLTLNLVDNGDGTMSVTSSYSYDNEIPSFVNRYSHTPIIPEVVNPTPGNSNPGHGNPNTFDKGFIFILIGAVIGILFIIERRIKIQRFE